MTWEELEVAVRKLAGKIDFSPDIIVGIVRGGLVPARLLSTYLNVREMYCLTVEKVGGERKITNEILEDLEGKKILLVEDMLETGKSLKIAKDCLEKKGAKVKTACLFVMPISEVGPDYSLEEKRELVKFPWE